MAVYGYCRVSTTKQNIDRQIRNIKDHYPDAYIFQDAYTGKKLHRPNFDKMLKVIKSGDTIIFDSVSRMSRNASEGIALYNELMSKDIELVFLKEPQINTATYKDAKQNALELEMTGDIIDCILKGINEYMKRLADRQIELAFESAQREVDELSQRTKEGLMTAKLNGKEIGIKEGTKLTTKKSIEAKEFIRKYNQAFEGSLNDKDTMALAKEQIGLGGRNSFYKYKRELLEEAE